MINIGFNVQTDKAVKSLNDLEKRLEEINQHVKILESKHKVELDVSGVTSAVKQVKDTVAKSNEVEIISDKSIKSTTDKIEALNEEIVKMRVTLNKPNNLNEKSVGAFASKLAEVSRRAQELQEVMSDKDLMSGLDAKEIAILNVELKSITAETNKIKNTMNSLTDGSIEFIKALENMNRKSISLESTLAEIKRQSIITGKVDVKSNVEQTLKELKSLKGKISKSYDSGSFVDMDEINKTFSLITNKTKQLEKDLTAPIKSILTAQKEGVLYGVQEKPKNYGVDKSVDSTIKKLLKVEEGLSYVGKNLGETSKLDVRSLMLYGKEVEKLQGDVQTLFNIFRNKDILESFKGDDLAKLQIFVENTVKGFNKLESSVGKFNSEGLKTIETLEKQSRALEVLKKQTEAQKQIAILGNKQEQVKSAETLLRSIDKVSKTITTTAFNPDYTEIAKTDARIQGLEGSFKSLKKEIETPPKAPKKDPLLESYDNLIYKIQTVELEKKKLDKILYSSTTISDSDKANIAKKMYSTDEVSGQLKTAIQALPQIEGGYSKETLTKLQFLLKEYENSVKEISVEINKLNNNKIDMEGSISQVELLKAQLENLAKVDPSTRAEKGLRDVSKEAMTLLSKVNMLEDAMGKIDDKSDIPKLKAQLIEVRGEFNKLNNSKLDVVPDKSGQGLGDFVGYYAVFNTIKSQMSNFMALEDATYDLGVVAQFTNDQIQTMRKTIIDTATTLPNSAIEITKAMDAVMRTGKSYEEATIIVKKTAELAVASGEDLADAVGIVNKLFLALEINARSTETVDKALQQLHATAVFTATDLEGLGESAKQWAGAVGGLVRTTTKTGAELETYKSQLLDMGTAFSGILSNMGRLKDVCSTSDPYVEKSA